MLNVNQFYWVFGCTPEGDGHMELAGKQVICQSDRFYIICLEQYADPFNWLSMAVDGVVFQTQSGYLAIMVLFDGEEDETNEACFLCQRLVGIV